VKTKKIIIELLPDTDIPHIQEEIKKIAGDKLIKISTEEPGPNF
jgi:hypothetical protein